MESTNEKKTTPEKTDDEPKVTSSNSLKQSEKLQNITILSKDSIESNEIVEKVASTALIETVFDKKSSDEAKNVSAAEQIPPDNQKDKKLEVNNEKHVSKESLLENISTPLPKIQKPLTEIEKRRVGSATSGFVSEKVNRNQSDIFSLKEETTIASSIFSVNGSPSRKVYRKVQKIPSVPFGQVAEPPSDQVTPRDKMRDKESYHEVKRPSSSLRNPLTGTGLNSNDEYKYKGNKRMDGNPLLGLGYTADASPSNHRIPPGGYAHKLW